jgi:hypothetical protein
MQQIELATLALVGIDGRWSAGVRFESRDDGVDMLVTRSVSSPTGFRECC